jgi:hypothetical protein
VVNNTCYKNGLDSRLGQVGEIQNNDVSDVHIINNVAVAWTNHYPYRTEEASGITFSHNIAFGGLPSLLPSDIRSSTALRVADPKFLAPIPIDPTADGQWTNAVPATSIGPRFRPAPASPLRTVGVDPRIAAGVDPAYRVTFDRVLSRDLAGRRRSAGRFSVGAYDS